MIRKLLILLVLGAILTGAALLAAPRAAHWYMEQRLLPRLAARLGCALAVGEVDLSWGEAHLGRIKLSCPGDDPEAPLVRASSVKARFQPAELLSGKAVVDAVLVNGLKLSIFRNKSGESNVEGIYKRLRGKKSGGGGGGGQGRYTIGPVKIQSGQLDVTDRASRFQLSAEKLSGALRSGGASHIDLKKVNLTAARLPHDVTVQGLRLLHEGDRGQWPTAQITGGQLRVLPRLELSAIRGSLKRGSGAAGKDRIVITLSGSYGGAEAQLWSAEGWLDPRKLEGLLNLTAKRFHLGRIASLLKKSPVIHPKKVTVDGKLEMSLKAGVITFGGGMEVKGLDLFHPGLALAVIPNLEGRVEAKGTVDLKKARLQLDGLTVKSGGVEAVLSGVVEQRQDKPFLDLRLQVPSVPCQTVLTSLPSALVPELKKFSLRGKFSMDVRSKIDFHDLDNLTLGGKMSIYRCKVVSAPGWVNAERLMGPFEHRVEPEPQEIKTLLVAPESPDFVEYTEISPMVTKALLTTEDGAFFRHRGFITSQFRAALSRNLKRGGFRLGASTISMQMVKNVLLTHDKTLSRKLQELFIVWYLEQNLSKERILEIYLNVIEYGPGIYGIGAAARHYFGKPAVAISPLEAAFFGTLLPSPKGRYVQYCKGKLSKRWDKYVRRVLRRMHSKGHISADELALGQGEQIIFQRDFDMFPVSDCEHKVKNLLEAWQEEKRDRLKAVILAAAPHQISLYFPPESGK